MKPSPSTEDGLAWAPDPNATMGSLTGTLSSLLRIPFEAQASRVYKALATSGYPEIREAHGAVFRHLPLVGASVSDLARRAGMAKQSMGYLVDSLVSLGYLEIRKDPSDRRVNIVQMSPKGIEMMRIATDIGKRIENEWAERMGVVEMGSLRALLKLLASSIPDLANADADPETRPPADVSSN
ncbi:hypothetical protein WDL1P1_00621 (plasmid) [Variovorax sp. WDL1]|nr:MarR family winged helix-turn-helix transcriptional regulator [Hydrogenophaga sp. PBL-H3]QHE78876.1 winged helix-turn-helix transcriptional regulator [Hydrogenophaga sp. PBL-H3]QHE83302.1 winged helix-turn-helix transcriptional regulator [Hydrogenophaga sp. PBL-H3]QHE89431.1 winged helix-turn-helix transcriptional regulator [Hydrogenophaga sp. BPS33]VTV17733.1 hypothetical protein WDL1P1_00621 [Variovorax sp. WDL1]